MIEAARAILRANDRAGYTVPTDRLYPFQWNWDSCFVALGWSTFNESRAFNEVKCLLEGQWEDGMVPQIVFHTPSDDYFPGPDVWGIDRSPPTSGITQPPILAAAVHRIWATARDKPAAEVRTASLYPSVLAYHRWWERARDPGHTGLVTTLHPWETGMDNSPAWDEALARVPSETTTPIRRRDTSHVDASMRPRAEEYQRFIHLVDCFRDAGWDPARMMAASPFRVADIATNAILLRAERDLLNLARRFGSAAERSEITARIDRMATAIAPMWSDRHNLYLSRDLITGALIEIPTSAGFLPLYGGGIPHNRASLMVHTLQSWGRSVRHLVPSTAPMDHRFEPRRYWRGPVWAVINWMIAEGLAEAGEVAAATLRADTSSLIATSGFSEYFDPLIGEGLGGANFSWTAAIALLLDRP
jgi:Trehalase